MLERKLALKSRIDQVLPLSCEGRQSARVGLDILPNLQIIGTLDAAEVDAFRIRAPAAQRAVGIAAIRLRISVYEIVENLRGRTFCLKDGRILTEISSAKRADTSRVR